MGVQTSDDNHGRLDHNVVIINWHLVENIDMVTDFMELYNINIKIQGERPFILVHTPVNYDTKRHGLIVISDAYNTRTWSEKSVRNAPPVGKSIRSSHLETLKLYDHRL